MGALGVDLRTTREVALVNLLLLIAAAAADPTIGRGGTVQNHRRLTAATAEKAAPDGVL